MVRARFRLAAVACGLLGLMVGARVVPAVAQSGAPAGRADGRSDGSPASDGSAPSSGPRPQDGSAPQAGATPSVSPGGASDKRASLDRMLDALKGAPTEQMASLVEDQVRQAWLQAGTPAVTLLMSRGLRSLQAGQNDEAVDTFSDAIVLEPDVAEAWHQRAIARYHAGDVTGAIHDLQETVKREPRDFAAFRTLTDIASARQDWKGAYAAWQKVLELDPKTPGGAERLRELKRRALGEDT